MKQLIMGVALMLGLSLMTSTMKPAEADDRILGTIIGAVGGGLLGSTVGKGDGRIVATAAGSVIGAVLGREIIGGDEPRYEERHPAPRKRVVYREPAPRKVVVVERSKPRYKKWERSARYGDDVLVCHKKGKHCQWRD